MQKYHPPTGREWYRKPSLPIRIEARYKEDRNGNSLKQVNLLKQKIH